LDSIAAFPMCRLHDGGQFNAPRHVECDGHYTASLT
jgi:hypothetical protein